MSIPENDPKLSGEKLPSADKADIIFVVPFFNEADNIPPFMKSFEASTQGINSVYLLGVNHRSKDNSEEIFNKYSATVGTVGIVREGAEVASVGIPRQKGLSTAIELAEEQAEKNRKVIVGSIDIDSRIPQGFFSDAINFLYGNEDFLVFPTRYDQRYFLDCVNNQQDEAAKVACAEDLIGIDWLKFKLRNELLKVGAVETRGSGGYFFTLDGYRKAEGHKAVYSRDGSIVTGESNAVGIRAKRAGATCRVGHHISIANPRRMLRAINKESSDYQITSSGKLFEATANVETLPVLDQEGWTRHFDKALFGALRTYVIKGLAYNVQEQIAQATPFINMNKLIEIASQVRETMDFQADERDAIGSQPYISTFETAFKKLDQNEQSELLQDIKSFIPSEEELMAWAFSNERDLENTL